jgi:hypothetical protein
MPVAEPLEPHARASARPIPGPRLHAATPALARRLAPRAETTSASAAATLPRDACSRAPRLRAPATLRARTAPVPVVVIGCSLLAAAALLLLAVTRGSPQRTLRAFRDPRLLARLDALTRELTRRGWTAMPPRADDPPTLRRLARGGALTLTVGCAPWSDWCSLELTRACGLAPGDLVAPPPFDRDGLRPRRHVLRDIRAAWFDPSTCPSGHKQAGTLTPRAGVHR